METDTASEDQVRTGREALAVVEASHDPDAKRWGASIRSNLGETLASQLRLERESEAASQPRDYIYRELELLYRAKALVK